MHKSNDSKAKWLLNFAIVLLIWDLYCLFLVAVTSVLKTCWALVKVVVTFCFSGDLVLPIAWVYIVGKLLKRERRER